MATPSHFGIDLVFESFDLSRQVLWVAALSAVDEWTNSFQEQLTN
jgi:hypothetical protein